MNTLKGLFATQGIDYDEIQKSFNETSNRL